MKEPIHIRRSSGILLMMILGCTVFVALWLLNDINFIEIEGASSLPFRLFILGVVLPALIWLCGMWAVCDRAMVGIYDDHVELRSGWLLSRSLILTLDGIREVSTNWTGPGSDSPSDLIFVLNPEGQRLASASNVLRRRGEAWLFLLAPSELPPTSAVEFINAHIKNA